MTTHAIFNRPMDGPVPQGLDQAIFGMGCYWGVERLFWQQNGVWLTQVGFAGGTVENPSYDQVKTGTTGHAEVVHVVFDSSKISYDHLLQLFWENHDPTQGDRQTMFGPSVLQFQKLGLQGLGFSAISPVTLLKQVLCMLPQNSSRPMMA